MSKRVMQWTSTSWYVVWELDYYNSFEAPVINKRKTYPPTHDLRKWPDGELVKNNQTVEVKWPNKRVTSEPLVVVDGHDSAQIDMNNIPDNFATRRLYVKVRYNGKDGLIPLRGLKIRRVYRERS